MTNNINEKKKKQYAKVLCLWVWNMFLCTKSYDSIKVTPKDRIKNQQKENFIKRVK